MIVSVSIGEYVDKIAILEVKLESINDPEKKVHIEKELRVLKDQYDPAFDPWLKRLKRVNRAIWDLIEIQKQKTSAGLFDKQYMRISRDVILFNDQRYRIKRDLNVTFKSKLFEEKSRLAG